MSSDAISAMFTDTVLEALFPAQRADRFFEAMYGDVSEGAYDISLVFDKQVDNTLKFQFHITNRPGQCLRCNMTYGLPEVFLRHPLININGIVKKIETLLNGKENIECWELGKTQEITTQLHVIPLTIKFKNSKS